MYRGPLPKCDPEKFSILVLFSSVGNFFLKSYFGVQLTCLKLFLGSRFQQPLPKLLTKPHCMAIAEFMSDIMIFLYAFFSLALLLPRAAVPGAGARPPRRAALALLPLVPRTRTTPPPFEI